MRTAAFAAMLYWYVCLMIAALSMLVPLTAHAQATVQLNDEERAIFTAFHPFRVALEREGITVQEGVKVDAYPGSTPVGVATTEDEPDLCIFIVAVRGNPSMEMFTEHAFSHGAGQTFIYGILAHEAAHCMQRHTRTYDKALIEKQADVFAVLWMARFEPEHRDAALREFIWVRSHFVQPGRTYESVPDLQATKGVDVSGMTFRQVFDKAQDVVRETEATR